jgi:hypothetical protein
MTQDLGVKMSKNKDEQADTPPPTIEGLSKRSQDLLFKIHQAQLADHQNTKRVSGVNSGVSNEDIELALGSVKADLDGASIGLLEETLDWLRDVGLYDLSLSLLEEAWASDLPLDFLGRVAQDWVGSILFGLGDESGASKIAHHLLPRAKELGPSLCGDLCDLWLEWGLADVAEELAIFVHEKQPGEISALFHLMICAKLRGAWEEALDWLKQIDERRAIGQSSVDPAIEWNRGLLAVALHRWDEARLAWGRVGFRFPEEDPAHAAQNQAKDYAHPGELSPVRLQMNLEQVANSQGQLPRSEVVWGRRIGPARVELTALPYYHPTYRCGDILLIDGVKAGQVDYNGETYPISPALSIWSSSPGETLRFYGAHTRLKQTLVLESIAQTLGERGWAIAHWTRFVRRETPQGDQLLQLALYLPPDKDLDEFAQVLRERQENEQLPQLFCPRYAELTGESVAEHKRGLIDLGVIEH